MINVVVTESLGIRQSCQYNKKCDILYLPLSKDYIFQRLITAHSDRQYRVPLSNSPALASTAFTRNSSLIHSLQVRHANFVCPAFFR
jgi:hypothetical protein